MYPTWANRSTFDYTGSVLTGTDIRYGRNLQHSQHVSAAEYAALRQHFLDREVAIGTSRTAPANDSIGAWLQAEVSRTALASYVGPILLLEGFAQRTAPSQIRVIR
ncbi:hypothetical protein [Pseudomonas fontis]|uniref:Uncharacterized protein n=1 Tax=Pseudomonas fontis TaxID=2942633 RepID=A0ABT5NYU5_9PSED|nr:hypothetical protein [Pseudomonas fontis]MDD0974007.1 hypothetical protein [Pseudomonas fontis]MDD0993373.1 hypothetical protein [Pseudomonas fontis]